MKKVIVIAGLVLSISSAVFAQIVVDSSEFLQAIGTTTIINGVDSAVLNLGTTGGPQVWDFTTQPMGNRNAQSIIVKGNSTPFSDSFPTANITYQKIKYADSSADTSYQYERLTKDSIITLGGGVSLDSGSYFIVLHPVGYKPLPMAYNNSWVDHYTYKYVDYNLSYDYYGYSTIDAYGKVKIPYGEFNCLRINTLDTVFLYLESLLYYDTLVTNTYSFVTENYGSVADVVLRVDSTDTVYSLSRLTSFTGVEERNFKLQNVALSIYPNPFPLSTVIKYQIPTDSKVSLNVYDISGKIVKALVNEEKQHGSYSINFNSKNYPTGIYFAKFQAGNYKETKKLILIK
ncbi:MAG: T9SS type A sorting domain-containing protein [bacterium]|nr:T9SS type A sorting domain-containing protein [bacterium]